jgi:hypothetical protein
MEDRSGSFPSFGMIRIQSAIASTIPLSKIFAALGRTMDQEFHFQ